MAKKKVKKQAAAPAKKTRGVFQLPARLRGDSALDKKSALVALTAPPDVKLPSTDPHLRRISVTNTPQQAAVERAGEAYKAALSASSRFADVVAAMIGLRRTYVVAYRELNDAIQALAEGGFEAPPELSDFAAQFAAYQASRPFDEHDMMQSVLTGVLPWLTGVVDAHTAADHAAAVAAAVEENERRRGRPVPIGFKYSPFQEDTALPRDRTLVLVGWRNAVLWLLDLVSQAVAAERLNAVRLAASAPKRPDDQSSSNYVRVAPNQWVGCANSDRTFDKMLAASVVPVVSGPVDVLVCDDVGDTHTAGFTGRDQAACGGDGHRLLRKWCDQVGAGLVCGLPTGREAPDPTGPAFEQLRAFAAVRPVVVREEGDDYLVCVGNEEATVLRVEKAVLDVYGSSIAVAS